MLKHLNNSKAFVEYSSDRDDIYRNIKKDNPNKKCQILIIFDNMTAGMLITKILNPIVIELFIRGRKSKISLVFNTQHIAYYFIMKLPNKHDFQQIEFNHSSDIDFKDFTNHYTKNSTKNSQ